MAFRMTSISPDDDHAENVPRVKLKTAKAQLRKSRDELTAARREVEQANARYAEVQQQLEAAKAHKQAKLLLYRKALHELPEKNREAGEDSIALKSNELEMESAQAWFRTAALKCLELESLLAEATTENIHKADDMLKQAEVCYARAKAAFDEAKRDRHIKRADLKESRLIADLDGLQLNHRTSSPTSSNSHVYECLSNRSGSFCPRNDESSTCIYYDDQRCILCATLLTDSNSNTPHMLTCGHFLCNECIHNTIRIVVSSMINPKSISDPASNNMLISFRLKCMNCK